MEEYNWLSGVPQQVRPVVVIILVIMGLLSLATYFLYIHNLGALLKAVRPENRKMAPVRVWLLLTGYVSFLVEWLGHAIHTSWSTFFTIVEDVFLFFPVLWQVIITYQISRSVASEFRSRGRTVVNRPALLIGLSYAVCCFFFIISGMIPDSSFQGSLMIALMLLTLVLWVAYWVETARYKKRLRALPDSDTESPLFGNLY